MLAQIRMLHPDRGPSIPMHQDGGGCGGQGLPGPRAQRACRAKVPVGLRAKRASRAKGPKGGPRAQWACWSKGPGALGPKGPVGPRAQRACWSKSPGALRVQRPLGPRAQRAFRAEGPGAPPSLQNCWGHFWRSLCFAVSPFSPPPCFTPLIICFFYLLLRM